MGQYYTVFFFRNEYIPLGIFSLPILILANLSTRSEPKTLLIIKFGKQIITVFGIIHNYQPDSNDGH